MRKGRLIGFLVLAAALACLAVFASRVRHPDTFFYTRASEQMIQPGCAEIHCFRVLAPWVIGMLPGPDLVRWKAYPVVMNALAGIAVFDLCVFLGLTQRASVIAAILTAFGFGSLYTVFEPYTSDPIMFFLAPLVTRLALDDRALGAGLAASIGVLAKEFVLMPLAMVALIDGWMGQWRRAWRVVAAAAAGFVVWLALNAVLRVAFGYNYGPNKSPNLLNGSYLAIWLGNMGIGPALVVIFNEFGALYPLIPFGMWRAPLRLRQLAVASLPFVLLLCYVEQPDRALWNFHFIGNPLAALVLEPMPNAFVVPFLGIYVLGNLRVGAQFDFVPSARYAFAVGTVLSAIAIVRMMRSAPRPAAAAGS